MGTTTTGAAGGAVTGTAFDPARVRALRNEAEYEAALAAIEQLMEGDPDPDSESGARLEGLSLLVEHYEDRHHPMGETSTPQSVVEFMAEQHGLSRGELAELVGGRSRLSEFLRGKRELS